MSKLAFSSARRSGLRTLAGSLIAGLVLVACGGGGSDTASSEQVTSYTAGTIGGFGSVIVNGVRFDDSAASVEDDDGNRSSSSSLKLGMQVEIDSGTIDDSTLRAVARHIRFGAELVGPVASVDTNANTFVVLGQTVEVKDNTVFDDSIVGGLGGLAGKIVEVHALFDAANSRYIATRIEDRAAVVLYKIRGVISNLDTQAKTFTLGTELISYANVPAANLPANLANGLRIRVRLETVQVNGAWVAVRVVNGVRTLDSLPDARVRGAVTTFTSSASFSVNGIPVDASNAIFDRGSAGVVLGANVEVRGNAVNGTIVATRVRVLSSSDDDVRGFELHGTASSVDTNANTFVLRDVNVSYGPLVVWVRGSEAQLTEGAKLEVKGLLSADGKSLVAASIKFED
jgi:Domain of unknown function (DUF5666)